jgi:hypothetical protein
MTFSAIPLAALLFAEPAIRALPPPVERPPAAAEAHPGGGLAPRKLYLLIAVIPARPAPRVEEDPSYVGVLGVDADGRRLEGGHRYAIHFEKDEVPPSDSIWSLSALANDPFRPGAEREEGMVGKGDPLRYNADGSLDIRLDNGPPPASGPVNWLRTPAGPFNVVAHVRWPNRRTADDDWRMPSVRRLD